MSDSVVAPGRRQRVFALVVLVVQACMLFAPRTPDTGIPSGWQVDKLAHFTIFALATWSVVRAGAPRRATVGAMICYAAASELIQHYLLPNRSGDPRDLLADVLGVAVAAALTRRQLGNSGAGQP